MQYMGGKSRVGRHFVAAITRSLAELGGAYYEPFMGGNSILCRLPEKYHDPDWAVLSDIDPALKTLYEHVLANGPPNGGLPGQMSQKRYDALRAADDPSDPLTAFAAYGVSYMGLRWAGRCAATKKDPHGRVQASRRSLVSKTRPATYLAGDYRELEIPPGSTIYCDPPYHGVTGYEAAPDFDHDEFYEWAERQTALGSHCLVSEFKAPGHWENVVDIERRNGMGFREMVQEHLFLARPSGVVSWWRGRQARERLAA